LKKSFEKQKTKNPKNKNQRIILFSAKQLFTKRLMIFVLYCEIIQICDFRLQSFAGKKEIVVRRRPFLSTKQKKTRVAKKKKKKKGGFFHQLFMQPALFI